MLVSVQSTNADEYKKVSNNLDIPWKCKYVKYYVSSLRTLSNILLTNDEDYFEMSNDSTHIQVYFRTPKFSNKLGFRFPYHSKKLCLIERIILNFKEN